MLHILPNRTGGAAENMALDFLLLQRYPKPESARIRHYSWRSPAITFGYSQRWKEIEALEVSDREICRRPTGGGVVDHADDWTYSLVIPRTHELGREPAPLVYYLIHRTLCDLFIEQGKDVVQQQEELVSDKKKRDPGLCFEQAEPHDLVDRMTGSKIAGAALKRTKNGLLLQGSIARKPVGNLDWGKFESNLYQRFAELLSLEGNEYPWPDFEPDHEMHLIDQFSDPAWNQRR